MQSNISFTRSMDGSHISDEAEASIAFLLSLPDTDDSSVDELVKVYYPFKIFDTETGSMVFDLLGYTVAKKPLLFPQDIKEVLTELRDVNEEARLDIIEKARNMLDEPDIGSISINGLVEDKELTGYLYGAVIHETDEKAELFKPLLTKKKFSSIKKQLQETKKERTGIHVSLMETMEQTQAVYDKVKQDQLKKTEAFMKESKKRLKTHEKQNMNAIKEAEKALETQFKRINEDIDQKVAENQKTQGTVSTKLDKLEGGDWETRKHRWEHDRALKKLVKEQENLEKERATKISIEEEKTESTKNMLNSEMDEARKEETAHNNQLQETHEITLRKISELVELLDQSETRLIKEQKSLSKIIDLKYEKGLTILVPFYIYRRGENSGFHPPIKAVEEKGVSKTLKLLFSDSILQKMGQYVTSDTMSFNTQMNRVLMELCTKSKLSVQYRKKISELNLLGSHSDIDRIEVGLYQLLEWQWISEKDYIMAQRYLVEKMDMLNGGNIFSRQVDPLLDTVDVVEITA
ncbi:hypothetical protein DRO66_07585 [Candidatus Bathyarchaeota archaeon]|nr:MAG: hypothetical protein DRO66_07585 [Candidatus Bathyarchaeota archaeon]